MDCISGDGELEESLSQARPASDCRFSPPHRCLVSNQNIIQDSSQVVVFPPLAEIGKLCLPRLGSVSMRHLGDDIDELDGTGGEDGEEESGMMVDYSKEDESGGGSKKHAAKQCQELPPLSRSRFWERAGRRTLFTVGLLAEAGLALLIQNYHPAQSSTGTQWPYNWLGQNDPAETTRDLHDPLSEGSSGLTWNYVDQFGLHLKVRDLVREPGPAAFASSSAAFSLCLISLMQQTRHHRYQNHLIIFGMFCGLLTSILPIGRHGTGETLSASMLTAYVPAASVLALLISLLLHTAYSSWRGPVEG